MGNYKEILPKQLTHNPFTRIEDDWMLVTAKKDDKVNTMTANWGGVGVIWYKKVAFIVLRPHRFTKEFVDFADSFSLTFFDEDYKKQLSYLGRVSGRDEDKIEKSNLTLTYDEDTPFFEEANTVLICRKLLATDLGEQDFIDKKIIKDIYKANDFHTLYIAEIEKVLVKED